MGKVTFKLFQYLYHHHKKRVAGQIVFSFMFESKLLQGTVADRKVNPGGKEREEEGRKNFK